MEQGSLLGGARRLATSSTALLGILAIVGAIVMNVTGRIDGERALDFIKWIVVAYFTKVAVEDGAEKLVLYQAGADPHLDESALASIAIEPTTKTEPTKEKK